MQHQFCQKILSEKKYIYVDQSGLIKVYNENMGSGPRIPKSQRIPSGNTWKECNFPLFAQCIDMTVQKACRLHKNNDVKLEKLEFVDQLLLGYSKQNN